MVPPKWCSMKINEDKIKLFMCSFCIVNRIPRQKGHCHWWTFMDIHVVEMQHLKKKEMLNKPIILAMKVHELQCPNFWHTCPLIKADRQIQCQSWSIVIGNHWQNTSAGKISSVISEVETFTGHMYATKLLKHMWDDRDLDIVWNLGDKKQDVLVMSISIEDKV